MAKKTLKKNKKAAKKAVKKVAKRVAKKAKKKVVREKKILATREPTKSPRVNPQQSFMEIDKSLGLELKTARVGAEISQTEVARKLGYKSAQFVSNWERALAFPPAKHMKKIASLYKVNEDYIIELMVKRYRQTLIASAK